MFKEERNTNLFKWIDIGNIEEGRPNLGPFTYVSMYRMLQFSVRDAMIKNVGVAKTNQIFFEAGYISGMEFCRQFLDTTLDHNKFFAELHLKLIEYKVGNLFIEKADFQKMELTITISEDLDCSGMEFSDETTCGFDEGFLVGIMKAYTGMDFSAREVDCWASGGKTCRFDVRSLSSGVVVG